MNAITQLEEQVLAILRNANGQPLSLPQIKERLSEAGLRQFGRHEIQDAVWQLISKCQADFTPRRYVKAVGNWETCRTVEVRGY